MDQHWKRFAVISDIHSNVGALEAVLADIDMNSSDGIVDLGDCVSGPLFPRETATLLMERAIPSIRGNHERQLVTLDHAQMGPSDAFADNELTVEQKRWIAERPESLLIGQDILALHGAPGNDLTYLLETVEAEGCRAARPEEVEVRLVGVGYALILCGHTHLQREIRLRDGRHVVNPGSVGLPAYSDDWPFPHKNEAGSPHARYAIIDRIDGGFRVEMKSVIYDWHAAAALAESRQRSDWAATLQTGRT